jgi:hypothetical protein
MNIPFQGLDKAPTSGGGCLLPFNCTNNRLVVKKLQNSFIYFTIMVLLCVVCALK